MLIWDAGTEIAGEQEDYYYPLFTYREGDEASCFVFNEPEGCAPDVGPSDAGEGRESLMVSSSRGSVVEPVASAMVEGGLGVATIIEALRTDELLPDPASSDLAKINASTVTTKVSAIEPIEVSTAVEGALKDIVEEMIKSGAMTTVTSTPSGNTIITYERSFFLFLGYLWPNKILMQASIPDRINFEGAGRPFWRG